LQENIKSVNVMQNDIVLCEGDFDINTIEKVEKDLPGYM
jgi:hypothetical protein